MIDIHQLKIFVLVAEKKSFSAAAEAVFLTQPTVSSHIKHLEERLGVILLDRLPRCVELTRAGEILYRYSLEILKLQRDAMDAIREFTGKITGILRIGGSTIPGEYILPGLMGQFIKEAPDVEVYLSIADSRQISEQVLEGALEIGMVGALPAGGDVLLSLPFCRDTLVLIVSRSHPMAMENAASINWSRLKKEPFWLREPGSGTRKTFADALAEKGSNLNEFDIIGQLGSTEAVKQAVMAGAGVSVVSSLSIQEDCLCGRLAQFTVTGLDLERKFYVIRHRYRTLSPAGMYFYNFLTGHRSSG